MSTTGVKRVGLGYQSDNTAPPVQAKQKAPAKRSNSFFLTGKRPMPPPVSSEDLRRTSMSPDEFGAMTRASAPELTTMVKEDSPNPVGIVRRAIKAMTAKR
ncbi:uncharacterized protein PHACADRAFT_261835 [Phanerochaete carnosa HHB-10118-sp]|uniref:Uncharacterized protein n=1 Tax=Phanerochaete carnosa (strain HHB-10118-sp) TaxID=650164 RepID=K5VYB1_PHACS|nr:uncharacterized protein PHACADRAFT_261835 [Phanerochaete carnosa HHB-10118-sp]EKM51594.1 hypothetical protein PHACADRAFT_261835 [Phanerochaete carnosa HHB-10118-sp]